MRRLAAALALAAVTMPACSGDDDTLTVFAASSLTSAFERIGEDFEAANPGTRVEFNFGASSDLADTITSGESLGTADVFASADEATMQQVVESGANDSGPVVFVENQPIIAVPAGNPGDVEGLEDFADDDLLIGLCDEEVPCGAYARDVLANAGVDPSIDTNEAMVADLVEKLASGDLDAGIVYASDVDAGGPALQPIDIPSDVNVVAEYPIVTLTESDHPDEAERFVEYVQSDEARRVFEDVGFRTPR